MIYVRRKEKKREMLITDGTTDRKKETKEIKYKRKKVYSKQERKRKERKKNARPLFADKGKAPEFVSAEHLSTSMSHVACHAQGKSQPTSAHLVLILLASAHCYIIVLSRTPGKHRQSSELPTAFTLMID